MKILDKINYLIRTLLDNIHRKRKAVLALSCIVVFVTTYVLILPAFTLDKTRAAGQGGIDIPSVTATSETEVPEQDGPDGTVTDASTQNSEPDEEAAEKAPEIQKDSGSSADAVSDAKEDTTSEVKEKEETSEAAADAEEDKEEEIPAAADKAPLVYEGDGYKVTVTDKASVLPAGTEISVEEITAETDKDQYKQLYKDALDAVKEDGGKASGKDKTEIKFAKFYDIKLISDGREITPDDSVTVTIEYDKDLQKELRVEDSDNVRVIHFAEDKKTGETEPQVLDNRKDNVELEVKNKKLTEAAFDAAGFSVYGVVYTEDTIIADYISASGETYEITVNFDEAADIPEGAELDVKEIAPGTGEYDKYLKKAVKKLGIDAESGPFARFFDISIVKDGKEYEPDNDVTVTIELKDMPENTGVNVVHYGLIMTDIIEGVEADAESVSFRTDAFSVYGVITTPGATSLDGKTVIISKPTNSGARPNYITSNVYNNETPQKLGKTDNVNDAAVWHFVSTGEPGKYYIYTLVGTTRRYMTITRNQGSNDSANLSLSNSPQALTVTNNGSLFRISDRIGNRDYYVNLWGGGGNNNGYACWNNGEDNNCQLTFNQSSTEDSEKYAVVVKYEGEYYVVATDGALTPVEYIPASNKVVMEDPLLWSYVPQSNGTYDLRIAAEAAKFDGNSLPVKYSYRYIDANSETGVKEEVIHSKDNVDDFSGQCALRYNDGSHTIASPDGSKYIGIKDDNGKLSIAGNKSQSDAAEIYFATVTTVPKPFGDGNTVNHIDISVRGTVDVRIPLAYGKYYYRDSNGEVQTLIVDAQHPAFSVLEDYAVSIKKEDMMHATVSAFRKNADGSKTELDDMFYITGYSANGTEAAGYEEPDQVRIEGSFKVSYTDVPGINYNGESRRARLDTPVYYTVTAPKNVTVPLMYNGFELYDQNPDDSSRDPLTAKAVVSLSASFNYWDFAHNTCPAAVNNLGGQWRSGDIPDGLDTDKYHSGSGMDFVLGGGSDASAQVYAVEITKILVDENGNRIKSNNHADNSFTVYRSDSVTANDVKDLDVGSYSTQPDYSSYLSQHSLDVEVGDDGLGSAYDYDVTPGVYYIQEDPDSIAETITDTNGKTWNYKETYFLTEYAWRNHPNDNYMHVSDTYSDRRGLYNSIPEVLGDHPSYNGTETFTNDFLEFYVYNVYESPKVDVPVIKSWEAFEDDEFDWNVDFRLQWAPLYPGETNPSATFQDVTPLQTITIRKDQMKDAESQAASLEDRTFKDLPKYGTDQNGNTFRYQYSLQETAYKVYNKTTGTLLYSWDLENGYNTDDEDTHYQPFYPHDAGENVEGQTQEENESDANYYIEVSNAKRNIRDKDYIDVSLDKQWDDSFDNPDESRWAEFELRRFKRTEYRDVSHMSDSDRGHPPITVTIVDGSGNVIDTLETLPNVGLYLAGNFAPHETEKSISFESDKPVRLASESHVSTINVTASGSNMSNAIVRSQEFFVTEDTVFTLTSGEANLVEGKGSARVLDTGAGTAPLPDSSFSQTIRLDSSNNWHFEQEDLVQTETSAGDDDDNENVTIYDYYFVEKDSNPKGYAQYFRADEDGNPTDIMSGDMDHQIEFDDSIVAVNGPLNRLIVRKLWRGVPDTTGFPTATFTLYQTWADGGNLATNDGWVYENNITHARYEHVELPSNTLEWICPEVLPTTRLDNNGVSRAVGYYVEEDVREGSMSKEGITTSWKFYYYLNSDGKQTNAGHQGYFAGFTGQALADRGGEITICNEMNAYMQLDIQKQYFKLEDAGSWDNVTSNAEMKRNAILGFQVIRAVKDSNGKWLDAFGNESDTPVWNDYGEEMLCGYDENGNAVVHRGENDLFWLHDAGGDWHFRIEDNQGDATNVNAGGAGLPSYGYYIRNGEDIPVEYWYSCRETNVYKDLDRTPYPEWDWFSSITPVNAYGPRKQVMEAFPKVFHGQDSMRIANFQASDLIIDKEWVGDPNAKEVYIKVWRTSEGSAPEDFTAIIAEDVRNNRNWQNYIDDPSSLDLSRDCLIIKLDNSGGGTASVKVNRALLGSLAETGKYHYYIQEVGYRNMSGEYKTNVGRYRPVYDKWVGSAEGGAYTGAPVSDYAGNNITIGAKGENRLKVINTATPSTSYTIIKKFEGSHSSTGGQSSVNGRYPGDGSKQVVVELQQRYRYEKIGDDGIAYVSADYDNWVRADSDEAKNTWTVDWQGAESARPVSVALPLPKPAGSTLSDEAWYSSAAAWTYTWEGLDLEKVIAEEAHPENTRKAQLYYRAVETSTPEWINSSISPEDGHKAINDEDQEEQQILDEQNDVINEQGSCDLDLNKEWTGIGEGKTWPAGYVVYYKLVQNYHIAKTDVSNTIVGEDGLIRIDPQYSYGPAVKSVDMTTNPQDASALDRFHPQATGTLEESNHNLNITGLPMYGFFTATEADVESAARRGVVLIEGRSYPVVYTYTAVETAVKKNGQDVGFKPQSVDAVRDETVTDKVQYEATLTNELVDFTVEKEWNGLRPPVPGENESATIQLRRFKVEPEPEPETEFTYTVNVTGDEAALASSGTVTATIFDENGEEVYSWTLGNGKWSHEFVLDAGGTYRAEFSGDGSILNASVDPAGVEEITGTGSIDIEATVKPVASGSAKLIITGNPGGVWTNPVAQYNDGQRDDSTAQKWNPDYFSGNVETEIISGLMPGKEYRFQLGPAPANVSGGTVMDEYGSKFISFIASDGLKEITLDYGNGARASRLSVRGIADQAVRGTLNAAATLTWTNSTDDLPDGADPEKDEVVDTVILSGNTWSKSWNELPKYSDDGKEYVYYAYESAYTGADGATAMETTYSVDEDGNLIVTNTPTYPAKGNLKVDKEVFYGTELNEQANGLTFTVGLFTDAEGTTRAKDGNGQDIPDKSITVTEGKGEVIFADLDPGIYYVYEVANGEAVTESGTIATIDGHDYTVTYDKTTGVEVEAAETAEMKVTNTKAPYELNLIKEDVNDSTKKLAGGKFELNRLVYDAEAETKISYDPEFAAREVTTSADGTAKFENLPLGYYEIKETDAPEGYNLPEDTVFYIRVSSTGVELVTRDDSADPDSWTSPADGKDGMVTFTATGETYTAEIGNEPGAELPHTGGIGTTIFYIFGSIFVITAGIYFASRRRVSR